MENGRCRMHGGTNPGRPIVHGRYSIKHQQSLQDKFQHFLEDPEPGSLLSELALLRALFQNFLDRFTDSAFIDKKTRDHAFDMAEGIGRLVERINRIFNQTALTQHDLQYLQVVLTSLLVKYIDDPEKQSAFLAELRSAIGSDRVGSIRSSTPQLTDDQ